MAQLKVWTKMIDSLPTILTLIDRYSRYLTLRGVRLDENGFPLLGASSFLDEWPNSIVPYKNRNTSLAADRHTTVICFYCNDRYIYPRLENVLDDVPEYRRFLGVIGADITVTDDMDLEWQVATMLLNHLFTAVLAINGIKVVANLRCGSTETLRYLSCIPHGVMCASGFLGCAKTDSVLDYTYAAKILTVMPSKLLIYGKHDVLAENQLSTLGIAYRQYDDVRKRCFAHRA